MNEHNNNFNYEYLIGLIASFMPFFLVNENSDNGIFGFSAIILSINLFLFIKVRCRAIKISGDLVLSLLALAMSIWLFFHCLFIKYTVSQEFIIWLNRQNKGIIVFNSGAFAFFMAALFLFVVAIIEVFRTKKQTLKIINYIFIGGSIIIMSMYIFIFPNIIFSKPKIEQNSQADKELIINEKRFGDLFNNGKVIEGYKAER